jgi:hypothetical protein
MRARVVAAVAAVVWLGFSLTAALRADEEGGAFRFGAFLGQALLAFGLGSLVVWLLRRRRSPAGRSRSATPARLVAAAIAAGVLTLVAGAQAVSENVACEGTAVAAPSTLLTRPLPAPLRLEPVDEAREAEVLRTAPGFGAETAEAEVITGPGGGIGTLVLLTSRTARLATDDIVAGIERATGGPTEEVALASGGPGFLARVRGGVTITAPVDECRAMVISAVEEDVARPIAQRVRGG